MKVLTKSEISEFLFENSELNKRDSKELVRLFFKEVIFALETGEFVKLSGFGNFYLRDKKSRPGRNPKTGKLVSIKARRVVVFKAGQKLKNRIEKIY
ncbi:MAG TPA: integration host factor subunit alpha [Buchnera sp. (in: enterobacteria)]|nr:integration host factor subunit alpha [Buchnera sp. (in: enterobacteria)]